MPQVRLLKFFLLGFLLGTAMSSEARNQAAIDSASHRYVRRYAVLKDVPFATHHIQALASGVNDKSAPVYVEIYNILVPATRIKQSTPHANTAQKQNAVFEKGDTLLVTLSILPNTKGIIEWEVIKPDTIANGQLLSVSDVVREGQQRLAAYRKAGSPKDYLLVSCVDLFPVVQRNGQYWTPKSVIAPDPFFDGLPAYMRREWYRVPSPYVLTQFFLIRSHATQYIDHADYMTINIKSPFLSSDAPWRTVRELLPATSHYEYSPAMGIVPEGVFRGVFEFWSRPRIGSGVFEYKPGIGLLSGSYNDYFYELDPGKPRLFFDRIIVDDKIHLR